MGTVSSTIRAILGWSAIALGSLLLLVLILFGVAWAINAGDEALTPEAQALLAPMHDPVPPEDNIYLALAGFNAPPGGSVLVAGQARIERYNQTLARAQRADPVKRIEMMSGVTSADDAGGLRFRGQLELKGPISSYWDETPAHRANVEKLMSDNAELYQRYRALHGQGGYFETCQPSTLAPLVFADRETRRLYLAAAVLEMRSDDPSRQREGLADLEDDLRLWRAVLTGEGALVSKMVAIASLHWDELLLADAIADPQAPVPVGASDAPAVVPDFAPEDWNIGKAFRIEFLVQVSILQQMRDLSESGWTAPDESGTPRWLARAGNSVGGHFLKINATENLFAEQTARLARGAALGARQEAVPDPFSTLRAVYNPVGKTLAATSEAAFADYRARAWDDAAFHRLLRLSYEIRRQRIPAEEVAAFLIRHPEWSRHPADGRPFLWDAKAGSLQVQLLQAHPPPDRPFLLHVWRPPAH